MSAEPLASDSQRGEAPTGSRLAQDAAPGGAPDSAQGAGIPEEPAGQAPPGRASAGFDEGAPIGPTPQQDFWEVLYSRRSIRKFKPDPVPRVLVNQVLHAGIWAPSSCNYQMWDFVAVDDPDVNRKLAQLSLQMGNAPVNVIVSYGRDFSEEAWANVQSASAAIQNMSLAAHALGLGTFWITQMGDAEKVREMVGLPYDRLVIAVLALGFPKITPKKGPKRRPMSQVAHWNRYAGRVIPSSVRPADWPSDLLAVYQRARVLNGLRHNKPREWETRALLGALERFVQKEAPAAGRDRWLDVLPCTGLLTERISRERPGWKIDVVERTPDVAEFVAARTRPVAGIRAWPRSQAHEGFELPPEGAYGMVTCFFRLEDLSPADRPALLGDMARWLAPGGRLVLGFVSRRSFHDWTERLRRRRGGLKGVEYVLSPDPNIGPFEALDPAEVERMCAAAGLRVVGRAGMQAVPQPEELEFRTRNFSERSKKLARAIGRALGALESLPGVQDARGRFRYLALEKG